MNGMGESEMRTISLWEHFALTIEVAPFQNLFLNPVKKLVRMVDPTMNEA